MSEIRFQVPGDEFASSRPKRRYKSFLDLSDFLLARGYVDSPGAAEKLSNQILLGIAAAAIVFALILWWSSGSGANAPVPKSRIDAALQVPALSVPPATSPHP